MTYFLVRRFGGSGGQVPAKDVWEVLWHGYDETLSWETNEFIVARHPGVEGPIYWGHDHGCSCYNGFDPDNFESGSRDQLLLAFDSWNPYTGDYPAKAIQLKEDFMEFYRTVNW